MRAAVDVMGGDHAPQEILKGCWEAAPLLDGDDLIRAYLHDTPLHALLVAMVPFAIPTNARFSGQWIIAPPNRTSIGPSAGTVAEGTGSSPTRAPTV